MSGRDLGLSSWHVGDAVADQLAAKLGAVLIDIKKERRPEYNGRGQNIHWDGVVSWSREGLFGQDYGTGASITRQVGTHKFYIFRDQLGDKAMKVALFGGDYGADNFNERKV